MPPTASTLHIYDELVEDNKKKKKNVLLAEKQHKKYGGRISNVQRSMDFDIRHGVTKDEVVTFLDKIRDDASYADIRDKECNSLERLSLLKNHFVGTTNRGL